MLDAVATHIDTFRRQQGRLPASLAELARSASLEPDALLLPGDDAAEAVDIGQGKSIRTSFPSGSSAIM